ncbi:MAG TPA: ornithine carbamoyltransferase, partial [Myxococcales bacterium]|nr:ornithine carbamoyltransferase [Myxococcales bacterium]
NEYRTRLQGQTLAMIFQKRSTRTRVSFEVGMYQLGGSALFLGASDIQIGRGESIADTSAVLSRYCDIMMARVYAHSDLVELAENASVPIINGLSDALHPCQVLADLQSINEHFGQMKGLKMCYVGDGNNMAHSLLIGCSRVGMDIAVVTPAGYAPDSAYVDKAKTHAAESGSTVTVTTSIEEGAAGSHAIYTDVWASMGQEEEQKKRLREFQKYQVDDRTMSFADPDAVFMHCLPAHRGEEVSASVADGAQSIIFDEAENRLHAQKSLMLFLKGAL